MFQVILARQADTGNVVAIKVIRKDMTVANDDVVCAFIERNVLTKTHLHPFLTKMYCSFQTEVSVASSIYADFNIKSFYLLKYLTCEQFSDYNSNMIMQYWLIKSYHVIVFPLNI